MKELLAAFDLTMFHFLNQTIANPLLDTVMPVLTDLNKMMLGRTLYLLGWMALFLHGNYVRKPHLIRKGRFVAVLLIILIIISDQLSSSVIKMIVQRPRPCWFEPGSIIIPGLRLLVECGGGYSFPSSHAVNSFAVATFIGHYYNPARPYLFTFAALMAISRVYVGVHYPSDIVAGAIIGSALAWLVAIGWEALGRRYPRLAVVPAGFDQ